MGGEYRKGLPPLGPRPGGLTGPPDPSVFCYGGGRGGNDGT